MSEALAKTLRRLGRTIQKNGYISSSDFGPLLIADPCNNGAYTKTKVLISKPSKHPGSGFRDQGRAVGCPSKSRWAFCSICSSFIPRMRAVGSDRFSTCECSQPPSTRSRTGKQSSSHQPWERNLKERDGIRWGGTNIIQSLNREHEEVTAGYREYMAGARQEQTAVDGSPMPMPMSPFPPLHQDKMYRRFNRTPLPHHDLYQPAIVPASTWPGKYLGRSPEDTHIDARRSLQAGLQPTWKGVEPTPLQRPSSVATSPPKHSTAALLSKQVDK